MTRALAFGLGVGAGIQAFRQWPADGPVSMTAAVGVFIVGLLCAYFGGRRGRQSTSSTAVAVASASAESSGNVLNVQLFQPGGDAASPHRVSSVLDMRVPEPDRVSWLSTPRHAAIEPEILLDGHDLEELGLQQIDDSA